MPVLCRFRVAPIMSPMDADRHARLQDLFFRALNASPDERNALLDRECGADAAFRAEIERLLAAHENSGAFLAAPAPLPMTVGQVSFSANTTDADSLRPRPNAKRCLQCDRTFSNEAMICPHDGELLVANPAVLVGTVFDEIFDIEAVLGQGGMGTVFKARHRLLRDIVALKLLPEDAQGGTVWQRRFLREGQAARRFRHPNAVTVYDLRITRDGRIYLVLEYVEGHTLRAEMKARGRLSPVDALAVAEPIASVLDTAHAAGVVHRDLKPENVMLSPDVDDRFRIKVLDLGIARLIEGDRAEVSKLSGNLTRPGVILGTPRYMSPEQWGERSRDGVRGVDGRTDIYSLGIMLYELVCGTPPYRADHVDDFRHHHIKTPVPDPTEEAPDLPIAYANAIVRAIAKDRVDRFATAGELIAALRRAIGIEAPRPTGTVLFGAALEHPAPDESPGGATASYDQLTGLDTPSTGVPAHQTAQNPPNNLPGQLSSFVGRGEDVARARAALSANACVTLLGTGGIGKTRLAIQVGREVLDAFPGGVWFADLSQLFDATLVPQTIANVFDVHEQPGTSVLSLLVERLKATRVLLILDNCEHLKTACATVAEELLRHCPDARLLATSREALGVTGEQMLDVGPLAAPVVDPGDPASVRIAGKSDAVRLFLDRARAVRRNIELNDQTVGPIVALCRRLEGIPLALELAAARCGVMTPAQILSRIEKRLDLLASRQEGVPDRHRTLRASIEWSYQLLAPPLQRVFAYLSVFRGGWTLEAAETIVESALSAFEPANADSTAESIDLIDALEQLRECSLVTAEERGDEMRFSMLETIREFASEQVFADNRALLRLLHARYTAQFTERAEPELAGPEQAAWLTRLADELENVRAAVDWSSRQPTSDLALRIVAAMGRFWVVRGLISEGLSVLRSALARQIGSPELRAKALNWAGNLASVASEIEAAREYHEEALGLRRNIGDKPGIAISLHNLGGIAADLGEFERADKLLDECLSISTELGDNLRIGQTLVNRGRAATERGEYKAAFEHLERGVQILEQQGHTYGVIVGTLCLGDTSQCSGDLDRAESYFKRSLGLATEIGEKTANAFALCGLGSVAQYRGDYDLAESLCGRVLDLASEMGSEELIATVKEILGEVALIRGRIADAKRLLHESLSLRAKHGLKSGIAACLEDLATVAAEEKSPARAVRLLAVAATLRASIGVPIAAIERPFHNAMTAKLRDALTPQKFDLVWEQGRKADLEATIQALLAE